MIARIGGASRTVSAASFRVNSANRTITRGIAQIGGSTVTIATFAPSLSASQSPALIGGTRFNSGSVTTNQVTITPEGGQAPYTYVWTKLGGAVGTINSPASANTTFSRFLNSGQTVIEDFRCTVTDDFGTTATVDVQVSFSSFEFDENNRQ